MTPISPRDWRMVDLGALTGFWFGTVICSGYGWKFHTPSFVMTVVLYWLDGLGRLRKWDDKLFRRDA